MIQRTSSTILALALGAAGCLAEGGDQDLHGPIAFHEYGEFSLAHKDGPPPLEGQTQREQVVPADDDYADDEFSSDAEFSKPPPLPPGQVLEEQTGPAQQRAPAQGPAQTRPRTWAARSSGLHSWGRGGASSGPVTAPGFRSSGRGPGAWGRDAGAQAGPVTVELTVTRNSLPEPVFAAFLGPDGAAVTSAQFTPNQEATRTISGTGPATLGFASFHKDGSIKNTYKPIIRSVQRVDPRSERRGGLRFVFPDEPLSGGHKYVVSVILQGQGQTAGDAEVAGTRSSGPARSVDQSEAGSSRLDRLERDHDRGPAQRDESEAGAPPMSPEGTETPTRQPSDGPTPPPLR